MLPDATEPTGKNLAAISGATGGLGRAFAVECASRGWDLFLTDLSADALELLAGGIRSGYGVKVFTQPCDLTIPASRAALFARMQAEGLKFTALINVAGMEYEGKFYEQASQQIFTIVRLNIEGTLAMTHALLNLRDPQAPFHMITVSSLAAFYPMPIKATYAASKRFLLNFSLALREEVRELGATVTVLCPAGLPTAPRCIQGIEAQGLIGLLTTRNVGEVASETIDAALQGKAVVIPGLINRVLQALGGLMPQKTVARLIHRRWQAAHKLRGLAKEMPPVLVKGNPSRQPGAD